MFACWSKILAAALRVWTSEVVDRCGVASPSFEMPPKAKQFNSLNFITQNARGIKNNDRIHEISAQVITHKLFAVCLQETWRNGEDIFIENDCTFILNGIDRNADNSRRGKGGVGIVLSKTARDAWNLAGSSVFTNFGPRIIAVRLLVKDNSNKDCHVYLVSAYAPIGVADQPLWDSFSHQSAKLHRYKT